MNEGCITPEQMEEVAEMAAPVFAQNLYDELLRDITARMKAEAASRAAVSGSPC